MTGLERASAPERDEGPRRGRPEAAAVIWRWREREAEERAAIAKVRREGGLRAAVAALVAGVLALTGRPFAGSVVLAIGAITLALAIASPRGGYAALTRTVERAGERVGRALTWLLLSPVFFLFFVPFGLLARRGARDRMGRRFDRSAPTYWTKRPPDPPGALERPY